MNMNCNRSTSTLFDLLIAVNGREETAAEVRVDAAVAAHLVHSLPLLFGHLAADDLGTGQCLPCARIGGFLGIRLATPHRGHLQESFNAH